METTKTTSELLREPFPDSFIKKKVAPDGFELSYVEGIDVINRLNDSCHSWSFLITKEFIKDGRHIKTGRLTIFDNASGKEIGTRENIGCSDVETENYDYGNAEKAAATDCLKRCAMLFGVGKQLYQKRSEESSVARKAYKNDLEDMEKIIENKDNVQQFQIDMIKRMFAAVEITEEWWCKALKINTPNDLDKQTIDSLMDGSHPVLAYLRSHGKNIEEAFNQGLEASNA